MHYLEDRLSKGEKEAKELAMTILKPAWLCEVADSYIGDPKAKELLTELAIKADSLSEYTYEGIIRYKGRTCIRKEAGVRQKLLECMHDSFVRGHSGMNGTYQRMKSFFYWSVIEYVQNCDICTRSKSENCKPPGLLQPL